MVAKINVYGDELRPSTGRHGINVSSQRVDELDQACMDFLKLLCRSQSEIWVIDIGGGDAAQTERMATLGATVVLVDLTDQRDTARRFNEKSGREAILFRQGDVRMMKFTRLPFRFDVIYSQRMMSCIRYPELRRLLTDLGNAAKQDARCFISAGGLDTEVGQDYPHRNLPVKERWSRLSAVMAQKHQIFVPECLYRESELIELVQLCGFNVISSWTSKFGSPKVIGAKF